MIWPRMYGKVHAQKLMQAQWDALSDSMKTLGNAAIIAEQHMRRLGVIWYANRLRPVALKPAHKLGRHRGWR